MAEVILISGGNLGDVSETLKRCNELIEREIGKITALSSVRRTKAWGYQSDADFLNQVLVVDTKIDALELLNKLQQIEKHLGRVKNTAQCSLLNIKRDYQDRIIDIDILFYDNEIINLPQLKVPHVLMHERDFVLEPLFEVCPDKIHPVYKMSVGQLREQLNKS